MKKLLLLIMFGAFISGANAQFSEYELPRTAMIPAYILKVGYNTTTVLVFPATIRKGDKGFSSIIAQKETDIDNILKVKAAVKDFEPTNLHVYTKDGKVYVFKVIYSNSPEITTYDLNNLTPFPGGSIDSTVKYIFPDRDAAFFKQHIDAIKEQHSFINKSATKFLLKFRLETINIDADNLYFRFSIKNKSSINCDIDFIRMYIRDSRKAKRTSVQQQEILPVFADTPPIVTGTSENTFVIVVPKFTIADKKRFKVELYEKNGGRNITLNIKNKHLLKAKPF